MGTTGALYVNLLGCFLYGVWARSYVAKNMPALASTFTSEFRMLKEAPHAPRGYVYASMMLLAGQVAAIPFVASIPSM